VRTLILFFSLFLLLSCGKCVIIEAEQFSDLGGWTLDPQFQDQTGSPYLLAHGLGNPVKDASTDVELPHSGPWHLYVRTYNWTSPWSENLGPGRFQLFVNGEDAGIFGDSGDKWNWVYAGEIVCKEGKNRVVLHDLTGFDGRVDAICFSETKQKIKRDSPVATSQKEFDFVVIGAGTAGICAAVSAARQGLTVALVNDFEILGGNNSSLVRVHLGGQICLDPYPALGNLVKEFGHSFFGNAGPAENYEDWKKSDIISAEKNITLFAPYHFMKAETKGGRISAVIVRGNRTGECIKLSAPLFADCTGDASLGVSAGADYFYGRESKDDYGETSAPTQRDSLVLGASIQWNTAADSSSFPQFAYGPNFTDESAERTDHGEWTWETGMDRDMITEAEYIRDYGVAVAYSNWSYLKNRLGLYPDRNLSWVSFVLGKRESRRLAGDLVLTETDILGQKIYEDGTATSSWSIDLHYPDPRNASFFPNGPFKSYCVQQPIEPYPIPYRCLYSRTVPNLFMAGRNISVTHIALGTTRVMRTCAMEGEVVGLAASVCSNLGIDPRELSRNHFDDLKLLMEKGAGNPAAPDNQHFNGR